mgnify:CR=1 FL=1
MEYNNNYKTNTSFWSTIKDWISWNYDVIIKILIAMLLIIGMYTCAHRDMEHINQRELDWTINDSTFVTKQDNLYIYRRTIEDEEYYFITNHQPGRLKMEQYIPVTKKNQNTVNITE